MILSACTHYALHVRGYDLPSANALCLSPILLPSSDNAAKQSCRNAQRHNKQTFFFFFRVGADGLIATDVPRPDKCRNYSDTPALECTLGK